MLALCSSCVADIWSQSKLDMCSKSQLLMREIWCLYHVMIDAQEMFNEQVHKIIENEVSVIRSLWSVDKKFKLVSTL